MNIFDYKIPLSDEDFTTLFENKNIKINRIVSSNNIKPKVYIQNENEFVIVLKGGAKLKIDNCIKILKEGEYLYIPANIPHEVLETKKGTLWITIHFT